MAQDWYFLPADIVGSIALKLETIEDFIRFSSVCRPWNRALSVIKPQWRPAPPVPWLLLPEDTYENQNCVGKVFNIINNKFYQLNLPQTLGKRCWGSAYGWVAMLGRDLKVELFNPITEARISFLSLEAIYKRGKAILRYGPTVSEAEKLETDETDWFMDCFLQKLIVLKVSSQGAGHEFVIMVIYHYNKRLAFARHGDQKWTSVKTTVGKKVGDVMVMGDNVFALCDDGSIQQWSVNEFYSGKIVVPIEYCPPSIPQVFKKLHTMEHAIYLVQSGDDLLMALRFKAFAKISDGSILDDGSYSSSDDDDDDDDDDGSDLDLYSNSDSNDSYCKTVYFRVFKVDHKHKIWEETKDFGNVALFVGDNYSMCVRVPRAKYLERNCIYFTDDLPEFWRLDNWGLDNGIYDNNHNEIRKLYDNDLRSPLYPSVWFIPQF